MKSKIHPLKAAIVLITLTFSLFAGADEGPVEGHQQPQSGNEPEKPREKGPVFSPLKVKPYTKRTYRA